MANRPDDDAERLQKITDQITPAMMEGIVFDALGNPVLNNVLQAYVQAKLLSIQQAGVPEHCRGNIGVCFSIVMQARAWNLGIGFVAQSSYMTKVDAMLAYNAQCLYAAIASRKVLKESMTVEIIGEGEQRRCKVSGHFHDDQEPREILSEPLQQLRPDRNTEGKVKGSPLWDKDPNQQLRYYTTRQWVRAFAPHVLGGVYDPDEIEEYRELRATREAPQPSGLLDRLNQNTGGPAPDGFNESGADQTLTNALKDSQRVRAPGTRRRRSAPAIEHKPQENLAPQVQQEQRQPELVQGGYTAPAGEKPDPPTTGTGVTKP